MKPLVSRNPLFRFFTFLFYEAVALPLLFINDIAVFGLRIRGREYVRALRGKGAVLVCNHVHKLDCTFVGILAAPRKVIYTAMAPLFQWKGIGPLIHILGAVPVPSPHASAASLFSFIREMSEEAAGGRFICVYPEGELILYCHSLRKLKDGAFLIAVRADVPVVPIVITGRDCKGIRWILGRRRPCLSVRAGKPLFPGKYLSLQDGVENLRLRAEASMMKMIEEDGRRPGRRKCGSAADDESDRVPERA
mgnify:CR=1 FL=1